MRCTVCEEIYEDPEKLPKSIFCGWVVGQLAGWLSGRLGGWSICWVDDQLAGWVIIWVVLLSGWLGRCLDVGQYVGWVDSIIARWWLGGWVDHMVGLVEWLIG